MKKIIILSCAILLTSQPMLLGIRLTNNAPPPISAVIRHPACWLSNEGGFGIGRCAIITINPSGTKCLLPGAALNITYGASLGKGATVVPSFTFGVKGDTYFTKGVSGEFALGPLALLGTPNVTETRNEVKVFDTIHFYDCPFIRWNSQQQDYTSVGHALRVTKNDQPLFFK